MTTLTAVHEAQYLVHVCLPSVCLAPTNTLLPSTDSIFRISTDGISSTLPQFSTFYPNCCRPSCTYFDRWFLSRSTDGWAAPRTDMETERTVRWHVLGILPGPPKCRPGPARPGSAHVSRPTCRSTVIQLLSMSAVPLPSYHRRRLLGGTLRSQSIPDESAPPPFDEL